MSDVAYQIVHNDFTGEEYEFLLKYFNYESYGKSIEASGTWVTLEEQNIIVEYYG